MNTSSLLRSTGELRIVHLTDAFDATRAFYEKTLQLVILSEWGRGEGDRGIIYALKDTQLEILEGPPSAPSESFYVYIEVEDIDALHAELSKTCEIVDPLTTRPWKHRNFSIRDPGGLKLKFFSKTE